MTDYLIPGLLYSLIALGGGLFIWARATDEGGLRRFFEQCFWYGLQFGAAIAGGLLLAEIAQACCYQPTYMNAPTFYKIAFATGFVLFAGPATLGVSVYLDWRRRSEDDRANCHQSDISESEH